MVSAARAEESIPKNVLAGHLGLSAAELPVARGRWLGYDHVNVQVALDAWLAEPGREHEIVGLTGSQYQGIGLADLSQPPSWLEVSVGAITTAARQCAPGGATRPCVCHALYLVTDQDGPLALLVEGPEEANSMERVAVEVACERCRARPAGD